MRKVKYCPSCCFETEFNYNECVECGYALKPKKKKDYDNFEEEDEWSESDWGYDYEDGGWD